MKNLLLVSILLFGLFNFGANAQDTLRVPNQYATIQSAIDASVDSDFVLVSEGIYFENIDFLGKKITVASEFLLDQDTSHISRTIIDGSQPANPDRASVVTFNTEEDTTSVLNGFTITGGFGAREFSDTDVIGGGIIVLGAGAKIINNHIINNKIESYNRLTWGGGIFIVTTEDYHVIVDNNHILNNINTNGLYRAFGGGIYCQGSGHVTIRNNLIKGNAVIEDTELINWARGGGGIATNGGSYQINNNTIVENSAKYGGGMFCMVNNLVGSHFSLINNTIAGNVASVKAGGVHFSFLGKFVSTNNIFWDNNAPEDPDFFCRADMDMTYCITQRDFPGTGNMQVDPQFEENTYNLSDGSPSIDAGNPDILYNDPGDPANQGDPLLPAKGSLRADIGSSGGNPSVQIFVPESHPRDKFQAAEFDDMPYRIALPKDYDENNNYPLTIVLHGAGHEGTDNEQQLYEGSCWKANAEYYDYNDFTLVPQCPEYTGLGSGWMNPNVLNTLYNLIQDFIDNYPIDTTKIVITGISVGGGGTWGMINLFPDFFAAAIPVVGPDMGFQDIKHVPVWAFHGDEDANVSVSITRNYIDNFEKTGLSAVYTQSLTNLEVENAIHNKSRLFYTEYEGMDHSISWYVYTKPYLFDWLKKQSLPLVRPDNSLINKSNVTAGQDSVLFTTSFVNPNDFQIDNSLIIDNYNQERISELPLYDDGFHGDGQAGDGIWGTYFSPDNEDTYRLGVQVNNLDRGHEFFFNDLASFSSKGPIELVGYEILTSDTVLSWGDRFSFNLILKNLGEETTIHDVEILISPIDACVKLDFPDVIIDSLASGETKETSMNRISLYRDCPATSIIPLKVDVYDNSFLLLTDTITINLGTTGIEDNTLDSEYAMTIDQIYPNPFNRSTNISYSLSSHSNLDIELYNLSGKCIKSLHLDNQAPGKYDFQWDAEDAPAGIYFVRFRQKEMVLTRKLIKQ